MSDVSVMFGTLLSNVLRHCFQVSRNSGFCCASVIRSFFRHEQARFRRGAICLPASELGPFSGIVVLGILPVSCTAALNPSAFGEKGNGVVSEWLCKKPNGLLLRPDYFVRSIL